MALQRFPRERYASLELNQVAFPKTGMVVSQTPLGAEFTAAAPCENGMWVLADKSKGTIGSAAAVTDTPIGIVYTAEKEYSSADFGLKNFHQVAGDYPRVGILGLGDTVTTNCLQYDDSENGFNATGSGDTAKTAVENMYDTLAAYATTPVYVKLVAGSPVPQLTKTKPASGVYGKVTKFYTVPNGEKGVKYEIVNV